MPNGNGNGKEYKGAWWEKWWRFTYLGGRRYRIWPGTGMYWEVE